MKMKSNLILTFVLIGILYKGQTVYYTYDYFTKSPVIDKVFHQVATLKEEGNRSIYEVSPIDNIDEGTNQFANGSLVVLKKDNFKYIQYNDGGALKIMDKLQDKIYYLIDEVPTMNWKIDSETKMIEGTVVQKATVYFRGRNYIAWFDPKRKVASGPWKFYGLEHLIVEVFSSDNKAYWKLKTKLTSKNEVIENPFKDAARADFISYKEYPQLAYGLSAKLKEALSKNPNNTIFEQDRNQLETKFEWEN